MFCLYLSSVFVCFHCVNMLPGCLLISRSVFLSASSPWDAEHSPPPLFGLEVCVSAGLYAGKPLMNFPNANLHGWRGGRPDRATHDLQQAKSQLQSIDVFLSFNGIFLAGCLHLFSVIKVDISLENVSHILTSGGSFGVEAPKVLLWRCAGGKGSVGTVDPVVVLPN